MTYEEWELADKEKRGTSAYGRDLALYFAIMALFILTLILVGGLDSRVSKLERETPSAESHQNERTGN